MARIFVYDLMTGKDITAFVTLRIGFDGTYRIFCDGLDITSNVIFGTDD